MAEMTHLNHALSAQLWAGNRRKVKQLLELYVSADVEVANKTIAEIASEHSADSVLKSLEKLNEQIDQVERTFLRRQQVIDNLSKSMQDHNTLHNFVEREIKTLPNLEQWASSLEAEGEKALRSYAKNEKARFGGNSLEAVDRSEDGALDEYVMPTVLNSWTLIEEKLTRLKSPTW